jgi:hypothetical protein
VTFESGSKEKEVNRRTAGRCRGPRSRE